jgi:hypothetical protein
MKKLHVTLLRAAIGAALVGFAATGCDHDAPLAVIPVETAVVPTTPVPLTGRAELAGVVRDGAGSGVSGATIRVAETDATATADATGAWAMTVPSDSTLTLVTSADGYATTFRESIVVAEGAAVTGFDVTLLPAGDVARLDALAPGDPTTRGLMALRLHSLSATCATAGAKVSVWPPLAATVVYARPGAGGVDEPDPTLVSVQDGTRVDVWLAGAIPPGNLYQITIEQPGCAPADAPSMGGVALTGLRHVDAQAYAEADLFLQ